MKAPQTKLCEFWIEGRFSPLKVSLISGCFYWRGHAWHHVAWSHVQFGAAFSLLNSIFDLRLLYGNTEMTNIPPLSCQDMNEILLQRVFWLWLIKSCSVGTCGLFLLAFVFWSSLSFPHTHHSLRTGSICPGSLHTLLPSFHASPSIIHIHLSDSFFCPFLTFPHIPPLPLFPLRTLFQLEHSWNTSALVSALITSHIFTHSRWAVTQHHWRNEAQTHMWLISWCDRQSSLSSPGNTRQIVNLFSQTHTHTHPSNLSRVAFRLASTSVSSFHWAPLTPFNYLFPWLGVIT